jgi:hypothetical protein
MMMAALKKITDTNLNFPHFQLAGIYPILNSNNNMVTCWLRLFNWHKASKDNNELWSKFREKWQFSSVTTESDEYLN